jgi:hypothetical protein
MLIKTTTTAALNRSSTNQCITRYAPWQWRLLRKIDRHHLASHQCLSGSIGNDSDASHILAGHLHHGAHVSALIKSCCCWHWFTYQEIGGLGLQRMNKVLDFNSVRIFVSLRERVAIGIVRAAGACRANDSGGARIVGLQHAGGTMNFDALICWCRASVCMLGLRMRGL